MSARTRKLARERREAAETRRRRMRVLACSGAAFVAVLAVGAVAKLLSDAPAPSAAVAPADVSTVLAADAVYGSPDAPVTVVEYASFTCSHCARFHEEAMPEFERDWIATGKARLVYRPFPLDGAALAAATVLACAPDATRGAVVSELHASVSGWSRSDDVAAAALAASGLSGRGLSEATACLRDGGAEERVLAGVRSAGDAVRSTPSFVIGGNVYPGFMSSAALGRLVEAVAAGG